MNRSLKSRIFISLGLVILFFIILLNLYLEQPKKVQDLIIKTEFSLQNSIGAVLFSTALPYELDTVGSSYIFWVDPTGKTELMQVGGLELNALIRANDRILLNTKEEVVTFSHSNGIRREQLTNCNVFSGYGQSNGYLPKQDLDYSLYNQAYNADGTGYISYIRWGNADRHYCREIESFIQSTGHDEDKVYLITTDIIQLKDIRLVELKFKGDTIIEEQYVLNDQSIADSNFFSKVVADQHYLYFIYSDHIDGIDQLKLMQVDKSTRKIVDSYPLQAYSDADIPRYFFYNKDSLHLVGSRLYYVDGLGAVYAFDLGTKTNHLMFSFLDYEPKDYLQDEHVFFKEETLYFFHYDESKSIHVIEQYSLEGERLSTIEVHGIKDQIKKKGVFLYDFKIW